MGLLKKVDWEGSFFIEHSLAKVNREVVKRLIKEGGWDIGVIPYEADPAFTITGDIIPIKDAAMHGFREADVTIRHQWPPKFTKPGIGRWILFQPWEYGAIPKDWHFPMKEQIDEVWVYSKSNKDAYVRCGIPEEKVRVIPLGVDEAVFNYKAAPIPLKTSKTFSFLFVGGTIFRKGIDILLKAYTEEFTAKDDVCLVIKDFGVDTFYKGATMGEWIKEYQKDIGKPEILYLDSVLPDIDLAGLYKACSCLVHPYRGEGFGLPIIEAMACGTPAIVPSMGPSRDYCNEENAFFVDSEEEKWTDRSISGLETVDYPWWINVNVRDLRKMMRQVFTNQKLAEEKGKRASEYILSHFTWDRTCQAVSTAIGEVLASPPRYVEPANEVSANNETDYAAENQRWKAGDSSAIHDRYTEALNYIIKNDYKTALEQLLIISEQMEGQPPGFHSEIWTSIAVCLFYDKKYKKAHEAFQAAIMLDPSNTELAIECYKAMLEAAEKLHPSGEAAEYCEMIGALYAQMGNDFAAEDMFAKGLKLVPDHVGLAEKMGALKAGIRQRAEKIIVSEKNQELPDLSKLYHHIAHSFEGDQAALIRRRQQWAPYFKAGDQVLDIGCGSGWFMEMLEEAGVSAIGLDFDPAKVHEGRIRGLNIHQMRAEDFLADKKGAFDGIFLGHIIEHLPPKEVLNLLIQCTAALKQHGKIIILTPHIGNPGVHETFWLDITHIRPYPRLLIVHILQALGLYVKESQLLENGFEYSVVAQKHCYEALWTSPVLNASGYAEEQKDFLNGLKPYPLKIQLAENEGFSKPHLQSHADLSYLLALKANQIEQPILHYQAGPAYQFSLPRAPLSIGRTMFETNSIPNGWLGRMQNLTEIWVPSQFNKQTFINGGLDEKKIFVLPGSINTKIFDPANAKPYKLEHPCSFHFLSVFDWNLRKGWDVLVRAFLEEFNQEDDVSLVMKIYKLLHPQVNPEDEIARITKMIGKKRPPKIQLIDTFLSNEEMVNLYAACDSFVMPSRGEGWGRPFMEAMAMGLPVIGTRWSAQVDFMNDENSYLLNIDKLCPVDPSMPFFYKGHLWAEPSIGHLKQLMRKVYEQTDDAKKVGQKARAYIAANYSIEKVAEMMNNRIGELVRKFYGQGGQE